MALSAETEGRKMQDDTESVAAGLRRARERAGMSFPELSRITGLPMTTLHNMFTGKVQHPSMAKLALVADALDEPRGPLLALAGYPADTLPLVADVTLARVRHVACALPADAVGEFLAKVMDVADEYDAMVRAQDHAGATARGVRP